jgi:hypothetical protein
MQYQNSLGSEWDRPPGLSEPLSRSLLVQYLHAILLDDRIRENIVRDPFHLFGSRIAIGAVTQSNLEEFALPHGGDARMAQPLERSLNGLALRIKNGGLGRYINAYFHEKNHCSGSTLSHSTEIGATIAV